MKKIAVTLYLTFALYGCAPPPPVESAPYEVCDTPNCGDDVVIVVEDD